MDASSNNLSEVVVTGYGTTRKSDMVGSVATVAPSILQGQSSGVIVAPQGAAYDKASPVVIRGTSMSYSVSKMKAANNAGDGAKKPTE